MYTPNIQLGPAQPWVVQTKVSGGASPAHRNTATKPVSVGNRGTGTAVVPSKPIKGAPPKGYTP